MMTLSRVEGIAYFGSQDIRRPIFKTFVANTDHMCAVHNCIQLGSCGIICCKGRHKKNTVFYDYSPKGGRGGLGKSEISLSEKTEIFFGTRGGGLTQSKMVLSEKMRFFGIFCQKGGILSEKTENFLEFFAKRGGVSANPKNPYQKNLGYPN